MVRPLPEPGIANTKRGGGEENKSLSIPSIPSDRRQKSLQEKVKQSTQND